MNITCTEKQPHIARSRYFLFSLFSSFFPPFLSFSSCSSPSSLVLLSLAPHVLPPPTRRERLVFFLPRELESLSRIPQRQIVCNAYLNTDTRYTLWSVLHTVAGLKDAREDSRGVTTFFSFIDCNDTGYAIEQRATAILLLVCHLVDDGIYN